MTPEIKNKIIEMKNDWVEEHNVLGMFKESPDLDITTFITSAFLEGARVGINIAGNMCRSTYTPTDAQYKYLGDGNYEMFGKNYTRNFTLPNTIDIEKEFLPQRAVTIDTDYKCPLLNGWTTDKVILIFGNVQGVNGEVIKAIANVNHCMRNMWLSEYKEPVKLTTRLCITNGKYISPNGHIYDKSILAKIVDGFNHDTINDTLTLGHIYDSCLSESFGLNSECISLQHVSHKITDMKLTDTDLTIDAVALDTPKGEILQKLLSVDPDGYMLQPRGFGMVDESGNVSEYTFLSFDVTRRPAKDCSTQKRIIFEETEPVNVDDNDIDKDYETPGKTEKTEKSEPKNNADNTKEDCNGIVINGKFHKLVDDEDRADEDEPFYNSCSDCSLFHLCDSIKSDIQVPCCVVSAICKESRQCHFEECEVCPTRKQNAYDDTSYGIVIDGALHKVIDVCETDPQQICEAIAKTANMLEETHNPKEQ